MRIAFLVFSLDTMGGTERSVVTQANALAEDHEVRLISVTRQAHRAAYDVDPRVRVDYLAHLVPGEAPGLVRRLRVDTAEGAALAQAPSLLVPAHWDSQFSALTDVALERFLPDLQADVLVTVTPGLLAAATQLANGRSGRPGPVIVHQEHRPSSFRVDGAECLRAFAPRADVVAVLTDDMARWLSDHLGPVAPEIVVVPNALPTGHLPRSGLSRPVIMAAGRLVEQKQFAKLIRAFAQVAADIPEWRLRIVGDGPQLGYLRRRAAEYELWDRVELPGATRAIGSEWARAGIAALSSRDEGLPLVLQEAMAAGLPVAAFDCVTGPRDLIEHEVNGLLVAPDSVSGLAVALRSLAQDPDLRHRLGAAASESVRRYTPDLVAAEWVRVFERAIARRDGGRLQRRAREVATAGRVVAGTPEREPAPLTPAQARQEILTLATSTAAGCGRGWFVLPPRGATPPTLVVPIEHRDRFLADLAGSPAPAYLSLVDVGAAGWPERRGPVADLATDLRRGRTQQVTLEPWPTTTVVLSDGAREERGAWLGQGCAVDVRFWDREPAGDLVSPVVNPWALRVPADLAVTERRVEGVTVPVPAFVAGPLVRHVDFPVDVVVTWVDGNDPAWAQRRAARQAQVGGAPSRAAAGAARYRSRDELRYALRSVHLFAPWVRRIHLLTDDQVPAWLDPEHPQIALVDHRDVLPAEALPTFNSHAIETGLARIPGLAEHFVYLNDDTMLGRPVPPELFFTPAGAPAVFPSPHPLGPELPGSPPWMQAGWHNRRLLEDAYGATLTDTMAHAPYPHRRSVYAEAGERFSEQVARTAHAPFRSDDDVSLASSLAQHYGLVTGQAVVGDIASAFVDLGAADLRTRLRDLLDRDRDCFCLGDAHTYGTPPERVAALLTELCEEYFPVAAPWEHHERRGD
jgi:glycosyltransferase involved in cell wall biosynthesis